MDLSKEVVELRREVEELKREVIVLKQREKEWERERQLLYQHLKAMKERLEKNNHEETTENNSGEVQKKIAYRLFRICFAAEEEEHKRRGRRGEGVRNSTQMAIDQVARCMDTSSTQVEEWVWGGQKSIQTPEVGKDFPLVWDLPVL